MPFHVGSSSEASALHRDGDERRPDRVGREAEYPRRGRCRRPGPGRPHPDARLAASPPASTGRRRDGRSETSSHRQTSVSGVARPRTSGRRANASASRLAEPPRRRPGGEETRASPGRRGESASAAARPAISPSATAASDPGDPADLPRGEDAGQDRLLPVSHTNTASADPSHPISRGSSRFGTRP